MKISYNRLWKLLIDKGMRKGELRDSAGISQSTMAKLAKNQNVNTDILVRICSALDCTLDQIVELTPDYEE